MALQEKDSLFELDDEGQLQESLTYNGLIDEDIVSVLKETASEDFYYTAISSRLHLCPKYVELILHYLAYLDLVNYGTSPRGSWITESGKKYLILRNKTER